MKNKSLAFTSVFFFAGALLLLLGSMVFREYSQAFFLMLDFIPEAAIAVLLLYLAKTADRDLLIKAKSWLLGIFILCAVNAVIMLITHAAFMVLIDGPGEHSALTRLFIKINYLNILPFALLLSDIPSAIRWGFSPMTVLSIFGNGLVLAGFIRAMLVLSRSVRTNDPESSLPAENPESAKMMSFTEALKTCFKKYFSFHGCATRAEYWWFHLFTSVVGASLIIPAICFLIKHDFRMYLIFMISLLVFTAVTIIPSISVGVRRIHDTGNRGYLICVPIANIINLLLPSVESSEFKSGRNYYPAANILGKIFVVFGLVFYILYMSSALGTVWLLSELRGMDLSSFSDNYDYPDDEDYPDYLDDYESYEDYEDYEDYEGYEDYEDYEDYEGAGETSRSEEDKI